MDKYKAAIKNYAFWQQQIKRLTNLISHASMTPLDFTSEVVTGGQSRCSDEEKELTIASYMPGGGTDKISTCIERLWEFNRLSLEDEGEEEAPKLCKSCGEVQKLINERKAAKKRFGIEKRRISALGRGIIKTH